MSVTVRRATDRSPVRLARVGVAAVVTLALAIGTPAPTRAAVFVDPADGGGTSDATAAYVAGTIGTASARVTGGAIVVAPPLGKTLGYSDSALAGFGSGSFAVVSTGNVDDIPYPDLLGSTALKGDVAGDPTRHDLTTWRVDFTVPATANCVKVDLRFLSKEAPYRVGSAFDDGLVVSLDDPAVTSPLVTVNGQGPLMTAASGRGTLFDGADLSGDGNGGATPTITAVRAIVPGTTSHSLYVGIYDGSPSSPASYGGDSAAFVDSLRAETVSSGACGTATTIGGPFRIGTIAPSKARLTLRTVVASGTAKATDWVLSAVGPSTISGRSGASSVTYREVTAGTYRLRATGPLTYRLSWACSGATIGYGLMLLEPAKAATCTMTARYFSPYVTGTFVIADRQAKLGYTVTFWSPYWYKKNSPSKGTLVTSFQGYASYVSTGKPKAGATWRTTAYASAHPPRTLPPIVAVAVATSVRKSGTTIYGDIIKVVLVKPSGVFGVGKIVGVLY